jgi:hypothetical protein
MQRHQIEHILRAATGITGATEFIILGSQAILGPYPLAPNELLTSMEADIYALRDPSLTDLIDGSIGEGSPFHQTFGYYAHGVGPETAVLPSGWRERLVPVHNQNTGGGTGLCIEVHDLAISKLVAGREKDLHFMAGLIQHGLAHTDTLAERLTETDLAPETRDLCEERLRRLAENAPG